MILDIESKDVEINQLHSQIEDCHYNLSHAQELIKSQDLMKYQEILDLLQDHRMTVTELHASLLASSHNHNRKKSRSIRLDETTIIILIIGVAGTVLLMSGIFGVVYWHQARKWKARDLEHMIDLHQAKPVPVTATVNTPVGNNRNDHHEEEFETPQPFAKELGNLNLVQAAVLDDIYDQMNIDNSVHEETQKTPRECA